MKKLYFIRHGESQAQVSGDWTTPESPLSQAGKIQAEQAAAEAIAEKIRFDIIVSSPYERALQTARIIAQHLGYPKDQIVIKDILKERFYGFLESDIKSVDFFKDHTYKDVDDIKGAETIEALQKRAELALQELKKLPQDTVLVVSHAAFGRALRRVINKQPPSYEYEGDRNLHQIPNAELVCWIEN